VIEIVEVNPSTASDEQLLAIHAIESACLAEMVPGDPGRNADEALAFYRHAPATQTNAYWLAGDVATAALYFHSPTGAYAQLYVASPHRRQGLGTALLDCVVAHGRELGAVKIYGSHATDAGVAFARHAGAVDMQREVKSVLDLGIAGLPEPNPPRGWRLETWIGSVPDEHIDAYTRARAAMDDAPGAADAVPPASVDRIRASEEALRQRGREMRLTVALRDGEIGAFTELRLSPGAASGFTDDTGTAAAHRGQGLATAVKVESLRRFKADHPAVQLVTTSNDETNEAMLAINRKLGFVAAATFTRAVLDL
jgi:mycothiol synthase